MREPEINIQNVCDLRYLSDMMKGKRPLIKEIMDVFLEQIPEELKSINDAITNADFPSIKKFAHTMRSSVPVMGITVLAPILQEMEHLGTTHTQLQKIKELNTQLVSICNRAISEINTERLNYD